MATEYTLDIDAVMNAADARKMLSSNLNLQRTSGIHLLAQGILVSVLEPTVASQKITKEAYSFRPTISVGFRFQTETGEDEIAARRTMLQATMLLLHAEKGNAVLLFNGENTRMLKLNSKLLISSEWQELATYSLFNEITLPHEICDLPSPLLQ